MEDKSTRKMFGTRLQADEINKIKLIARALGLTDGEALSRIIRGYTPSPALQRAIDSLIEADAALAELRETTDLTAA